MWNVCSCITKDSENQVLAEVFEGLMDWVSQHASTERDSPGQYKADSVIIYIRHKHKKQFPLQQLTRTRLRYLVTNLQLMCTTYKPVHQKICLHWRKRLHMRLLRELHIQHFEGWTVVSVPAKPKNTTKRQQESHAVIALWASPTKYQIVTMHHEWWLTVTFFMNGQWDSHCHHCPLTSSASCQHCT
jgi:hypothetical protein